MIMAGAALLLALSTGLLLPDQISFRMALLLGIPGVLLGAVGGVALLIEGGGLIERPNARPARRPPSFPSSSRLSR
jgi:hypothetical protein